MADFRNCLRIVPAESIGALCQPQPLPTCCWHAAEVQTAKVVSRIHVNEPTRSVLRDFLINIGAGFQNENPRQVISFDKSFIGENRHHISKLAEGRLAAKGAASRS